MAQGGNRASGCWNNSRGGPGSQGVRRCPATCAKRGARHDPDARDAPPAPAPAGPLRRGRPGRARQRPRGDAVRGQPGRGQEPGRDAGARAPAHPRDRSRATTSPWASGGSRAGATARSTASAPSSGCPTATTSKSPTGWRGAPGARGSPPRRPAPWWPTRSARSALPRVVAVTYPANRASQRVLDKLGFERRGIREYKGVQATYHVLTRLRLGRAHGRRFCSLTLSRPHRHT